MIKLRPLLIVTGALRVEGGETAARRDSLRDAQGDHDRVMTSVTREVSRDRRRANVLVVNCARRLRKLRLLRTPHGSLVNPDRLEDVKALVALASIEAAGFNATSADCKLDNGLLWEPLAGNRREAVEAWVAAKIAAGVTEVCRAFPELDPQRKT